MSKQQSLAEKIQGLKQQLGDELLLLAHHYQRPEVVALADVLGDSFLLAQKAAASKAKRIVLCGVRFMGEGADLLSSEQQKVYMPSLEAGCPLAEMASLGELSYLYDLLANDGGAPVVPVCYINTNTDIKHFCGEHGGAVCTSSNARLIFEWAIAKGRRLLFLPDRYLGLNTWLTMGQAENTTALWDFRERKAISGDLASARMIIWNGFCHVHQWFSAAHVQRTMKQFPGARLIVHPECPPEITKAAEAVGSTSFLVDFVNKAKPGETIVIGTEQNLVYRLAAENPDKRIVELAPSPCPNMMKTTLANLGEVLELWPDDRIVTVEPSLRASASLALQRMLEIASGKPL
jgi:quinolinate synthase